MAKRLEDMTEPELREVLNKCANSVKWHLGKKNQFVLLVFDDPKIAQYVSSCTRESMIEALREAADRLERNQDTRRD